MEGEAGRRHGGPVKVAPFLLFPFLLYGLRLLLLGAIAGIFSGRRGRGSQGVVLGEHLDIRTPTAKPH